MAGPLVPANLEVLRSLVGTPWLPDLAGTIVGLEEIGERPYRIDRALTQLITSGAFAGVRGFAIGQLYACDEPPAGNPDSPDARTVVRERLQSLGVPLVLGLPFGHLPHEHAALPCGSRVELDPAGRRCRCSSRSRCAQGEDGGDGARVDASQRSNERPSATAARQRDGRARVGKVTGRARG
ncbi:hypothetical protein [Nannocystis pusilla]|uniref:hypothetical protein n=1 Tax=Nannocystis pusilla TaxID=889268 RepID=UPI003B7A1D81